MFKRIIMLLSIFTLLFAFVTYQPQKVEANGVSTVVSFAARQALKASTKAAVTDTVGSLALKVATKEVAEKYVKKEGLELVVLEGGKKAMVKTSMTTAQKDVLKKEIDNVIDLKTYGNAPGWIKFLDWFVGVGAVILVGQVLYAAVTGDFSAFISEIFNEAMTNLGWLMPAVPLTPDGSVPTADPVTFPDSTPIYHPSHPTNPVPIPSSNYHNLRDDFSTSPITFNQLFKFPSRFLYDTTISYEVMNDVVYSDTSFPMPRYVETINNGSLDYMKNSYPLDLQSLASRKIMPALSTSSPLGSGFRYQVKYGSTVIASDLSEYALSSSNLLLPSSFSYGKYNKLVIQYPTFDKNIGAIVSRLYLFSTHFKLPTLFAMATKPFTGQTIPPISNSETNFANLQFRTYTTSSSPSINPVNLRLGIHSSLELALNSDSLPMPKINQTEIKVPIFSPDTGKVAWPQKTIFPDGYTYNPDSQTLTDPSGKPVTDISTVPQKNPDPVVQVNPDGDVFVDGVPINQKYPDPVPGVDPVPPGGTNPPITTGDPKEINWAKLKAIPGIFTKKFPFSLPWDAKRFVDSVLGSIPQAKDISVKLDEIGGMHIGMDITLPNFFDPFFDFSRIITLIIFDIGLIYGLYRLLGGAS